MQERKLYGKLILDFALIVLLALMYEKRAISMKFHEWGGIGLFGLFLLHNDLNRQWIGSVTAAIFSRRGKVNARWVAAVLLSVTMTGTLVTGLLISKTLPTATAGGHSIQSWHKCFAAGALALAGVHLGLHGGLLKNKLWRKLSLPPRAGKIAGAVLLCGLFAIGVWQLSASSFLSYAAAPFGRMSFSQADFPSFSEMDHAPGEGMGKNNGMGKGQNAGMGNGLGRRNSAQGGEQAAHGSPAEVLVTYSSILGGFAVVTAAVASLPGKCRRMHTDIGQ